MNRIALIAALFAIATPAASLACAMPTYDDVAIAKALDEIDRHPDRFLFATDINSFGPRHTIAADLMATARKALAPLPRETQDLIAHGNVERLLGSCAK